MDALAVAARGGVVLAGSGLALYVRPFIWQWAAKSTHHHYSTAASVGLSATSACIMEGWKGDDAGVPDSNAS